MNEWMEEDNLHFGPKETSVLVEMKLNFERLYHKFSIKYFYRKKNTSNTEHIY